jgi:MurNAc alpha-1-phosphate uridylyltransferase
MARRPPIGAMILAAGRGERMRPLSATRPKPLLEAGGKALLRWQIEALARAGFRDVVVNVAYFPDQFLAAFGDGAALGVRITWSVEPEALETAGGIATALPLLGDAPFVAVNGDIHCDFDFARLAGALPEDADAHLVLVDNPAHHPRGDFTLAHGRLGNGDAPRLTFAGIGVYRPRLFAGIAPRTRASLAPLLRAAADRGALSGERHGGLWTDVGTPERLAELDARLRHA